MNDLAISQQQQAQSSRDIVSVEEHRAVAEVQAAMMLARRFPRDQIAARDRILNACTRPSLAESAIYQYVRGGTDISGPSIRLAEAIAQSWGNIKTSVRELDQSGGVSTVQAIAWDLETGYQADKIFQVPHIRHTKKGTIRLEDPRDIYELVANQGARRLRACILAVIPGDVTEAAVEQCEVTLRAKADTSPEAIAKLVAAFAKFNVTAHQIERRIQRRLEAIQPAQIVALKKVYASLRDNMSTSADWFEPEAQVDENAEPQNKIDAVKDKLRRKRAETAETPPQQPTSEQMPAPVDDPFVAEMEKAEKEQAR